MTSKSVTVDECEYKHLDWERKHNNIRWLLRSLFGAASLLAGIIGLSVWAGYDARSELKIHTAGKIERDVRIDETLARIETEQRSQRNLLENLLRSDEHSHPGPP